MQRNTAAKMLQKLLLTGGYSLAELAKELQVTPGLIRQLCHGESLSSELELKLIRLYCRTAFTEKSLEY